MNILVAGNMGYVGPVVIRHLRARLPEATLHGLDNAYFAHCLAGASALPERLVDEQIFADIRGSRLDLSDYDAVVQLAAISNDPMGNKFQEVTYDINYRATVSLGRAAAAAGVKNFVFASSCSVYGIADGAPRRETDLLNPITAYAKSKIAAEQELQSLASDMTITCLRFATACGMSDRLRLDLVLNDFVACALGSGRITVLSDGSPWRPLIDVADMARAIEWAVSRRAENGGQVLSVNVGSDDRNYQVRDLAEAVAAEVPGTDVSINTSAPVDSRSYKVDFGLYRSLAPMHQPRVTLQESIRELIDGMRRMNFSDSEFRTSDLIRLKVLQDHVDSGRLDQQLVWAKGDAKMLEDA